MKKVLIVVLVFLWCTAILGGLAVEGIGTIAHQRRQSPESAAIGNLRTILGAENAYFSAKDVYAPLEKLTAASRPYLDGKWDEIRNGYRFTVTVSPDGKHFKGVAIPDKSTKRATRRFYVDDTGVIRYATEGTEPTENSTPIGE